jgi:opacity protein-like surface antigen
LSGGSPIRSHSGTKPSPANQDGKTQTTIITYPRRWTAPNGDNSLRRPLFCLLPKRVGGTVDQTTTRFLGSIRGRAGFAWNQFLVFGTGGWGFADLNHNNPGGVPADNSFTRNGATAGGGVQWAFNQNWSVGAEYRHYWLGTYSAAPTGLSAFQVSNRLDTVTARISYKFGP